MEVVSELELPSPKRQRVAAPTLSSIAEPPDYLDDFSDIYGTPSKEEGNQIGKVSPPVIGTQNLPPSATSDPPSLPCLPGLGIASVKIGTATTVMEIKPNCENDLGPSNQIDMKNLETNCPEELRNNPEISFQADALEDAVDSSGSKPMKVSFINGTSTSNLHNDLENVMRPVEQASLLDVLPPLGKVDGSVEDPLAFLEASLPSEPTQKKGAQEMKNMGNKEDAQDLVEAPTFERLALANKHNTDAEFELDSSPLNSDSDSSDEISSSNDSDDDDDEYEMLDPEEQARRLMAEDGGSDDDGTAAKEKASGPLRTQNEKPDEYVPKPDVIVTEEMKIEELGGVEGTVENVVLIKAKVSGEYQVLEQGSVLCLEDKSVIGVVAETLGRVQQPFYSVRFSNLAAIAETGIAKSTKIFYVEQLSTSVFTQPLRAFKGSDASNLHDEEVGDDELEFSDDEAEAEHKRRAKMQRQQKRPGREGYMEGFSRGPRGGRGAFGRGGRKRGVTSYNGTHLMPGALEQMPKVAETTLDYDDNANEMNVDGDDLYTPLARPSNLHEIMRSQAGFSDNLGSQIGTNKAVPHSRGKGRGDRGGGRGGPGRGRGQGGGGFRNRGGTSEQQQPNNVLPSSSHHANSFTQSSAQPYPSNTYQTGITAQQQQQPFSSFHGQYPQSHWNHSPPFQYPPQQYNSDAYQPHQQHQQQYHSYPQTSLPSNLPTSANNSIPAGAHINPAFFMQRQQQHQSPQPQQWPPQT